MSESLLALPFGLAVGLSLGLIGGGGSILAVPVLVYVIGENVKEATTESLLIVGATALVGSFGYARMGRIEWRTGALFGLAGIVGSIAGTVLNRQVSSRSILIGFALVLLGAAYGMLRGFGGSGPRQHAESRAEHRWPLVASVGVVTGVLTGFFGVGGGFVIVPALVLLLGVPMTLAVGTSLLVIAITSAAALVAHLATGPIGWAVALAFMGSAMAGALTGSRLSQRFSGRRLSQMFAILVLGIALVLLGESLTQLF